MLMNGNPTNAPKDAHDRGLRNTDLNAGIPMDGVDEAPSTRLRHKTTYPAGPVGNYLKNR